MVSPKVAPCERACPAGIDVPRYIRSIRGGHFSEALAVVRERIPFPLVCGYACAHPCEPACARLQYDEAIAIRLLKRAAAEHGWHASPVFSRKAETGKRVGIVGAGPCGLTAAHYLVLLGHSVTVFEALEQPGGMLRYGIPAYRLPDEVIDADIRLIEQCGVRILTNSRIESAEALVEQGYDAVLLASGAWAAARMHIPGEEHHGAIDGISFLRSVNDGAAPAVGPRVVVVGGGDTAIDAARVCRRLGADVVQIYRRSRGEMPATEEEISAAIEEGVKIEFLTAPVGIGANALTCVRMKLGLPDASGRRRPEPVAGSEFTIAVDTVIAAIGQRPEVPARNLARRPDGAIEADSATLATASVGIFAGGDAAGGPATIIHAIAHGRRAAAGIDRFLGGSGDLEQFAREKPDAELKDAAAREDRRRAFAAAPVPERLAGFSLAEQCYDPRTAMDEARRCLSCDLRVFAVRIDAALCKDCGYCKEVCGLNVFDRSTEYNANGYRFYVAERAENCVGCFRCSDICPDFAIEVADMGEAQRSKCHCSVTVREPVVVPR